MFSSKPKDWYSPLSIVFFRSMGCLAGFAPGLNTVLFPSSLTCASSKTKKNELFRAKLSDDDDPLFQSAINTATVRFQETLQPEPLFVDPYASCFLRPSVMLNSKHSFYNYCLATRFIDDKLINTMNQIDGIKQVVLLTDGMDARPYRLSWPTSTLVFDISPERVFSKAAEKLEAVGAKIPRGCLFRHIPLESSDIQLNLRKQGFNGNRPSIWALQGLPMMTLTSFEEILFIVSSLAMKGCLLLGELPAWLAGTEITSKSNTMKWVNKIFMSGGFLVDVIGYNDVAWRLGRQPGSEEDHKNMLFVAEHFRFSDDQMETWRREFQRLEDEGDEEGFEEI